MHKIEFKIKTPIILGSDKIMFDSLLAYVLYQESGIRDGYVYDKNMPNLDIDIPISLHPNGYSICSIMQGEKCERSEYTYKKKYRTNYSHLAKTPAKVQINKGEYKSCQIPFQAFSYEKVWFCFKTQNLDNVVRLCEKLVGLGKKVSTGNGMIESFDILDFDEDIWDNNILRPIPERFLDLSKYVDIEKKNRTWKYPYWSGDYELCVIEGKRREI